ncbi:MAG: hypothetical protein ACXVLQ_06705 [Bacteriovorax sp.]
MRFFIISFMIASNLYALEYSKIDFEGCPENAFCKKETGANRKKWLELLKSFSKGQLSEQKLNAILQSEYGLPVSGWAQEEASLLPNILMWDSPCKQHRSQATKFYISEVFRKNLNANDLKEFPTLTFSHALLIENGKSPYTMIVPRGDAPLFMQDGSLYFLREDEGIFYGLMVDKEGRFRITKSEPSANPPKESTCTKEHVALFMREAPSPNFYQGHYCKDIWDKTSKSYKTILLGWSCN